MVRHWSEDNGERGRQVIQSVQQGLLAEGIAVPLTKLCAWFGVPRRTVHYKPTKAAPTIDWISLYNHRRPHQPLEMKTSAEAFALAA